MSTPFQLVIDARDPELLSGGRTVLEGRSVPLATRRERVDAEATRLVDLGATLTVVMREDGVDAYAVGPGKP
jgi:hypothetical protein